MSAPAMKLSGLEDMKTTAFTSGLVATGPEKICCASSCMPLEMVFIFPGPLKRTVVSVMSG